MLNISKKNHKFLLKLFPKLIELGMMTKEESCNILSAVTPMPFDWKRLTQYCLWTAVCSLVIAITAIFSDKWLLLFFSRFFTAPALVKTIGCAILATLFYSTGSIRKIKKPQNVYTNESILFLGILATAGAISFLGNFIGLDENHFSLLILIASICYGILGFFLKSQLIWCFCFFSLGGWFGAETGYLSGWGAYFLSFNYPLRFLFFGIISLFFTITLRNNSIFQPFYAVTRNVGLLYLFLSLWMMSIFGNYWDMESWYQVKQIELFHWSLLFASASAIAIYLGCKWDEGAYRGFGITFLFINLYTRFFELFWNSLHTAIFFFILAISLWYLVRHVN